MIPGCGSTNTSEVNLTGTSASLSHQHRDQTLAPISLLGRQTIPSSPREPSAARFQPRIVTFPVPSQAFEARRNEPIARDQQEEHITRVYDSNALQRLQTGPLPIYEPNLTREENSEPATHIIDHDALEQLQTDPRTTHRPDLPQDSSERNIGRNPGFVGMATGRLVRTVKSQRPDRSTLRYLIPMAGWATGYLPLCAIPATIYYLTPTSQSTDQVVLAGSTGIQTRSPGVAATVYVQESGVEGIKRLWSMGPGVLPTRVSERVEAVGRTIQAASQGVSTLPTHVFYRLNGSGVSSEEASNRAADGVPLVVKKIAIEGGKLVIIAVTGAFSPATGMALAAALKRDDAPRVVGRTLGAAGSGDSFWKRPIKGFIGSQVPGLMTRSWKYFTSNSRS